MSNQQRVFKNVLGGLKKMLPTAKQGHTASLAMLITGLVLGKNAQLSKISNEVPWPAKNESIEKRLRRWVKNPNVAPEVYFIPFAQQLLVHLAASSTLVLALDGSMIGRRCMVLMVGVVYHQRMLPLAWVTYRGKKGHAPVHIHLEVLRQVLPLIPEGADVILLGDGEYDNIAMLAWLAAETDWQVVVRTAKNIRVCSEDEWFSLDELYLEPGEQLALPAVQFTRQAYGPVQVILWWDEHEKQPIYLVTNMALAAEACHWYTYRYRIETLFSDKKSRGFQLDKSHLSDPRRLARLLLATSLAYIWMIYLGIDNLLNGKRQLIDRTDRRDKSIFRLGLDWLTYLLKYEMLLPPLNFEPPPLPLSAI